MGRNERTGRSEGERFQGMGQERIPKEVVAGLENFAPVLLESMADDVYKLSLQNPSESAEAGAAAYDRVFGSAPALKGLLDHPVTKEAGITSETQLFFIDGLAVEDYIKMRDPGFSSRGFSEKEKLIKREIMAASTDGKHHVELGVPALDELGNMSVQVATINLDLHVLDGKERWYERSRAHQAERLMADDAGKDQRHAKIKQIQSEKIFAAAMQNREKKRQMDSFEPMYSNTRPIPERLLESFVGLDRVQEMQSLSFELRRGGFGGVLSLSVLHLMHDHPEIRFADAMDPQKFQEEKRKAGQEVVDILMGAKDHPEALSQMIAEGARQLSSMDIGKEMAYAMGLPDNISTEEKKAAFTDINNQKATTAFLKNMQVFCVGAHQALEMTTERKAVQFWKGHSSADSNVSQQTRAVYDGVYDRLSDEDRTRYMNFFENFKGDKHPGALGVVQNAFKVYDLSLVKSNDVLGSTVATQRLKEVLAENGRIAEMSMEDHVAINQIEKYGNEISKKLSPAVKEGMAVNGVDAGTCGKIIRETAEKMYREQVVVTGLDDYYFDADTPEKQRQIESAGNTLEGKSRIPGMGRAPSRESFAQLIMFTKGYTMNEILSDSPAIRTASKEAGEDLLWFLGANPAADEKGKVPEKSGRAYGALFRTSGLKILDEPFPDVDLTDPIQAASVSKRLSALSRVCIDHDQGSDFWKHNKDFQNSFESEEERTHITNSIQTAAYAAGFALDAVNPNIHPQMRAVGMIMTARYASLLAGKTISEIGQAIDPMKLMIEATQLNVAFETKFKGNEEEKNQALDAYLNGGPCPISVEDALKADMNKGGKKAEKEPKTGNSRVEVTDFNQFVQGGKSAAPAKSVPASPSRDALTSEAPKRTK